MLKYSIIIPTHNGSSKLKKCLEHISVLNKPKFDFEVIVIDNGSKDDTAVIAKKYDFVRYFYDETPGLHTGRHLGAQKAQGEILCYLDDDSFVSENWLVEIEKTFSNQEVKIAGGNNIPLFEHNPPKWLDYYWTETPFGKLMGQLSLIQFNDNEFDYHPGIVWGCNYIIRKDVLFNFGGFNPDGMPQSIIKYRGDGETALSNKLLKEGVHARFNSKIKIHHYVPKSRMTLEYFKRRAFNQGVSDSYTQLRAEHGIFQPVEFVEPRLPKKNFFKRKYEKILRPLIQKVSKKFDKNYKEYIEINNEYKKAYDEGFNFHQTEVKKDSELLKWVLKENYFD